MTKIIANDLGKDLVASLLQFLAFKYQDPIVKHGTEIQLGSAGSTDTKEVKLLLDKFLNQNGLIDYGVLNHSGVLEIVHSKPDEPKPTKPETLSPTMPFWPPYNVHPVAPSDMIEWSGKPPPVLRKKKN